MKQTAALDVQQVLEEQKFGGYHLLLTSLCAVSVLMDGFDAQAMGFVAPTLAQQWHIQRSAMSPILSAGQVGMLLGALLFGPLADRFGRKTILVLCTLWFGVLSLLTTRADSVQSMVILRLITGFGLGGTMPNAIALTSEYTPPNPRLLITAFPAVIVLARYVHGKWWTALLCVNGAMLVGLSALTFVGTTLRP